ncbi:hypothetical protein [Kocuria sp. PD6]|uniref:hypothetical protein n=1 Tax=Kocuria sp. PD6 TaxID=2962590 RepID=UPI002881CD0D|nr:hypothetical protein [Kocuria sp. PD6]MDT0120713.1 hypothetical protein [Kocuria sp. PD6]
METQENTVTITADAQQAGGWWTARATSHELPPATARSLTSVTTQLKKIAGDILGVPQEGIDLTVSTELPDDVQLLVDQAGEHQQEAEAASRQARENLLRAAVELKETGWPVRDIASRLRLSSKTITEATSRGTDAPAAAAETEDAVETEDVA